MSKLRDDFCVFILTHGRADRVITYESLKKGGYTGRTIMLIDDEDDQEQQYIDKYGINNIYKFCKQTYIDNTDTMDNHERRKVILYARNACFDAAKALGYRYFLELDDDYTTFLYRFVKGEKLMSKPITDLNTVFEKMLRFLDVSGAQTVAICQGGDFIGGKDNKRLKERVLRKAMNTFFCDTEKPFQFVGAINEDVNMYTHDGSVGKLIMSVTDMQICQMQTQSNEGGMTDVYLDSGTYIKSFFTVMIMPSAVKVGVMGASHMRIHHKVDWMMCVPKILSERYRKPLEV